MDTIINFLTENYPIFLTVTIILLFALIGYIYDNKKNKEDIFTRNEREMQEMSVENIQIDENKNINDLVSDTKNINPETKQVELTDKEILEDIQE